MLIGVNARLLYSDTLEGIARYIYETTLEMAYTHPEDNFILYFDRKPSGHLSFPKNVSCKVIYLPTRHPILWKIWFDWLLPKQIKKDLVDVFYSGDGYVSLRSDIPQVIVTHDLAYKHYPEQISPAILRYYRKYIPLFHQKAKHVIAVSQYTKNEIQSFFDIPEAKISVAYNAIRPETSSDALVKEHFKQKISASTPYFCYVGAIHPRKNVTTLCKAFQLFKTRTGSNAKLLLAGRMAWMTENIKKILQKNDDIIYLGVITEVEKSLLLQNSLALVYISLFEGFGIPILEAMHANTPVITSNITSMPEVAGQAAILVSPWDVSEIAEAFSTVLDSEIRKKYIDLGKQRVPSFHWIKTGEIIYQALKKSSSNSNELK